MRACEGAIETNVITLRTWVGVAVTTNDGVADEEFEGSGTAVMTDR